ncbi:winged helix-turn-helix domain-containing protein [Candidatus Solirubrobacter pratensis]|uniref:winged helix-turn-helix domain-containing protein n=1 Tax=Candidatus Solirubrobacter pratensis TaxID=1298857 RepID=UPI0038992DD1
MRPVLELTEDGSDWTAASIRQSMISEYQLSDEDVEERLPSGRDTTLRNRVGWALTYLYRAGLLDRPRRSVYRINDRGRQVLRDYPDRVDKSTLTRFRSFGISSRATHHPAARVSRRACRPNSRSPTSPRPRSALRRRTASSAPRS